MLVSFGKGDVVGKNVTTVELNISGTFLARNTLVNFTGQIVLLIAGVVTVPFVLRTLGAERFGILSLAWVVLGYFSIFDLGLGRATTKFVAEAVGAGAESEIPGVFWSSIMSQIVMGIIGALTFASIAPLLIGRILNVPVELVDETLSVFRVLALSVPVILVAGSASGVLEAAQRFELVNAVRIPSGVLTYLAPVIGLSIGFQLGGIVALVVLTRFIALLVFLVLDFRTFPSLRRISAGFIVLPRLVSFGGWLMLSNIIGPLLRYFDRFMIGSLISMSAVAYFSLPFDMIQRLWIFPNSVVMTLFPAFSALSSLDESVRSQEMMFRTCKYLLVLMTPIALILVALAKPVFAVWLGSEFASNTFLIFQILVLGAFVGVLAPVPASLIQARGRPDIIPKLYLIYLPINVFLVWLLSSSFGLPGAAISFVIRTALDTGLLFLIATRLLQLPLTRLIRGFHFAAGSVGAVGFLLLISNLHISSVLQGITLLCELLGFVLIVNRWILNGRDRTAVKRFVMGGWGTR